MTVAAEVCGNCAAVTSDIRVIDFGRSGLWSVCGTCLDKWRDDDEREPEEEADHD